MGRKYATNQKHDYVLMENFINTIFEIWNLFIRMESCS